MYSLPLKNDPEWTYLQPRRLRLPFVPKDAQPAVRKLLAKFLSKIPLKGGNCYWTAHTVTHLADSPRVRYVEGLWTRAENNPYFVKEDIAGAPHAWNLIDGYPVCLIGELYSIDDEQDTPWIYEAVKDFSVEQVRHALDIDWMWENDAASIPFKGKPRVEDTFGDTQVLLKHEWWNNGGSEETLPEAVRSTSEPNQSKYGRPEGEYTDAAVQAWLKSPDKARYDADYDAFQEAHDEALDSILFADAQRRIEARFADVLVGAA